MRTREKGSDASERQTEYAGEQSERAPQNERSEDNPDTIIPPLSCRGDFFYSKSMIRSCIMVCDFRLLRLFLDSWLVCHCSLTYYMLYHKKFLEE